MELFVYSILFISNGGVRRKSSSSSSSMAVQSKPPLGQSGANSATTYTTQQLYPAGTGSTSRVPPLPSTSNNVSRRGATAADLSRSVEYVYRLFLDISKITLGGF